MERKKRMNHTIPSKNYDHEQRLKYFIVEKYILFKLLICIYLSSNYNILKFVLNIKVFCVVKFVKRVRFVQFSVNAQHKVNNVYFQSYNSYTAVCNLLRLSIAGRVIITLNWSAHKDIVAISCSINIIHTLF